MDDHHIIQKLNAQKFSQILDITFKFLTEKQTSQAFPLYKSFCESNDLNFSDIEPLLKTLSHTAKEAVKKSKTRIQLHDELLKHGLNEDQVQMFAKQFENAQASIAQATVAETIPINPLLDMEWKFGVSSASNQLNTIGNVFLQIKLEVDQGSDKTKIVCFELQLSEFYAFLHEMERARASLDYLS